MEDVDCPLICDLEDIFVFYLFTALLYIRMFLLFRTKLFSHISPPS